MTTRNARVLAAAAALAGLALAAPAIGGDPRSVIELTQVGCQFLESEHGVNHGYKTAKMADCEAINGKTGAARLAKSRVLTLKPGTYFFRVKNQNVPYPLGFWIRSKGYNWKIRCTS